MMKKRSDLLPNNSVIPVAVIDSISDGLKLADILIKEALPILEVTFRSKNASDILKAIKDHYPDLTVAAGTIINPEQAKLAYTSDADFLVSPGCNPRTIQTAQDLGVMIVPGVNSPTAIEMALNYGVTTMKFFPAEASGGIEMIKAILAPYQEIQLIPTGGINDSNFRDYLAIDRVIACGMSWMVEKRLINDGNWTEIARRVRLVKELLDASPTK
ncbi:bifunctional 4-hydroxy-2-oxoglutarate aldolase/2-dehydro-3-deoxy-phosphogluconate aldolase [Wohlfahrtiimonas sp. G9077]|uniref:bifunctional 4-hydroxy-2-oxoglutarate aldolase/2-dehydro-3-deoxy-phosphogluconate aldolase n=1 Tax=Wohlfahrtiimonas sp. G9077 TaxID=1980118 RepID=UPI000B980803|nr:bifunctional 4-hydroxy-2-oxoglutarate aldolase/2-dehydro-3-deoxy-phosphogluconate aldolase [Wohlfahrtiimonas sp. G9077]OYQ75359.1 2-dehydro-3-deoxyphosphogluconate aldolase [Wohlfahrtiimonas sp. G9077]